MIVANTPEEAAKFLSEMAQRTAAFSKNWENYEKLCLEILQQCIKIGEERAKSS